MGQNAAIKEQEVGNHNPSSCLYYLDSSTSYLPGSSNVFSKQEETTTSLRHVNQEQSLWTVANNYSNCHCIKKDGFRRTTNKIKLLVWCLIFTQTGWLYSRIPVTSVNWSLTILTVSTILLVFNMSAHTHTNNNNDNGSKMVRKCTNLVNYIKPCLDRSRVLSNMRVSRLQGCFFKSDFKTGGKWEFQRHWLSNGMVHFRGVWNQITRFLQA